MFAKEISRDGMLPTCEMDAVALKVLARFPDPLLEVGRGYSVSIPW